MRNCAACLTMLAYSTDSAFFLVGAPSLDLSLIHPRAFFSQSTGPSLRSDTVACGYYRFSFPENLSNVIFHVINASSEQSSGFAIANEMQSRTENYNY